MAAAKKKVRVTAQYQWAGIGAIGVDGCIDSIEPSKIGSAKGPLKSMNVVIVGPMFLHHAKSAHQSSINQILL